MKHFTLFFLVPALLCTTASFAQGHGGGGHGGGGHSAGGHGGGHSGGWHGGYAHSGAHSGAQTSPGHNAAGRNASRTTAGSARGVNQMNGYRGNPRYNNTTTAPRNGINGAPNYNYNPNEHWNSYPYYYYGSYGYSPYYDPYFSMWSFGLNFMYTPHYGPAPPDNSNNGSGDNAVNTKEPMQGFLVYEHDTISGDIRLTRSAVQLETADTARSYDYKFKLKQTGLQYIAVYDNGDDENRLDLVRLKDDKRLMRIIHQGKLNMYDGRTGFIYRPEDIDVSSIVVQYNGHEESIHSSSVGKTKEWLTNCVNKVYGLELKPKDFKWKELLVYIDKLD